VGVMFALPFRRLPAPIAMISSARDSRGTPSVPFLLAYGFLSLDLPEYFQRLSLGWRDPSFELLVVHLVTSLRFPVGRKIARRVMRRKS
jgi:hypothetical protein